MGGFSFPGIAPRRPTPPPSLISAAFSLGSPSPRDHLRVVSLRQEIGARMVPFFNVLINAHANLGCVSCAFPVLGKMLRVGCSPDVVTFNTLLPRGGGRLCMKGEDGIDEATEFFQRMVQNDCPVNAITSNIVINGIVQTGLVHEAFILLRDIDNYYTSAGDCRPDVFTFNAVILRL